MARSLLFLYPFSFFEVRREAKNRPPFYFQSKIDSSHRTQEYYVPGLNEYSAAAWLNSI